MMNEKIIDDTIQRMLDAEIDDATIISTLKDVGLSEVDARAQIERIKSSSGETDDDVESQIDDNSRLNSMQNEVSAQAQKSELHETTTHNMLNMHEQKIDDVARNIDEVKQTVYQTAEKINSPGEPTSGKLSEIAASQKALMKLLNDVLEVNRKILTELQMKK
ncbi:MAG: hypothetical protein WC915_02060 [archaeon]